MTVRCCRLCQVIPWPREWESRRCAFPDGVFQTENWNCATMNVLRDIAEALGTTMRADDAEGSIGYVPLGDEDITGYLVMTWYKNRGRTHSALVLRLDDPPLPVTEDIALQAVRVFAENDWSFYWRVVGLEHKQRELDQLQEEIRAVLRSIGVVASGGEATKRVDPGNEGVHVTISWDGR